MEEQQEGLVLQRLLENKLFVKADKCELYSSTGYFLGNVVVQGQLKLDPTKIRALEDWPTPTSC